jgi:hydrogenase nickel incorporation protein HypA/HybF
MHEYGIARALLDRVHAAARAHSTVRVVAVHVRIGELSGVDAGLLRTAYEVCCPGTACSGATLDIAAVPVRWTCARCGADVPSDGPRRCRTCGAPARLAEGDELLLDRIELEVT